MDCPYAFDMPCSVNSIIPVDSTQKYNTSLYHTPEELIFLKKCDMTHYKNQFCDNPLKPSTASRWIGVNHQRQVLIRLS